MLHPMMLEFDDIKIIAEFYSDFDYDKGKKEFIYNLLKYNVF